MKEEVPERRYVLHKKKVVLLSSIDNNPLSTHVNINIKSTNKNPVIELREV